MGTCAKQLRPVPVTQQRDTQVVSRADRGQRRSDPGCVHRCTVRLACDRRQTRLRPPIRQQPARRLGDLAVRSLATPHRSALDRRVNHTLLGSLITLNWQAAFDPERTSALLSSPPRSRRSDPHTGTCWAPSARRHTSPQAIAPGPRPAADLNVGTCARFGEFGRLQCSWDRRLARQSICVVRWLAA